MSIKINYSNYSKDKTANAYTLFTKENFNTKYIVTFFSNSEITYIQNILKKRDLKKNILSFDLNSKTKIILIDMNRDEKDFEDYIEEEAMYWGKYDSSGHNYGYKLAWDVLDDKALLKEKCEEKIEECYHKITSVSNYISKLENELENI